MCSWRMVVFTCVYGALLACKSCGTLWVAVKFNLILAVGPGVLCSRQLVELILYVSWLSGL